AIQASGQRVSDSGIGKVMAELVGTGYTIQHDETGRWEAVAEDDGFTLGGEGGPGDWTESDRRKYRSSQKGWERVGPKGKMEYRYGDKKPGSRGKKVAEEKPPKPLKPPKFTGSADEIHKRIEGLKAKGSISNEEANQLAVDIGQMDQRQ